MMNRRFRSRLIDIGTLAAALLLVAATATPGRAQDSGNAADPAAALADTLVAACRANETEFANHLTAANAAARR